MKNNNKGKGKVIRTTIFLVLLVVVLCFLCIPLFKNLKFGLDLQGGFEILYKVESIDGSKMTHDKIMATYKTLSKRIDSLGVTEPEITIEGNDKIRVKLAGVTNPEEARKQLSTVATLSFRDSEDNLLMTSDVLVSGGAKVSQDSSGNPAVSLSVKDKEEFYKVTNKVKDYDQNLIVIWLDYNENEDSYASEGSLCGTEESNCLSAATVSQGFASDVIIQGNFTEEQVENLVDLINSGSLPSKLTEISSQTVGASFGDNTLQTTFNDYLSFFIDDYKDVETYTDFIARYYSYEDVDPKIIKYKQSDAIINDLDCFLEDYIANAKIEDDILESKNHLMTME